MKMRLKMKNRYDINRLRTIHRPKYTIYKTCLSVMIVVCIKQQLSNIRSSIHEKVKQYKGLVEKKRYL